MHFLLSDYRYWKLMQELVGRKNSIPGIRSTRHTVNSPHSRWQIFSTDI